MMITNVRGSMSGVTGTVVYDPENPADCSIRAVVDVKTLNTQDEKRDGHVKSADFLDAEQFPTITFVSKSIERVSSEEWKATGDLTLHGVTQEVVLDVEGPTPEAKDPWGNLRSGASAKAKIKRSDFGLTWNAPIETGGVLISDDLKIDLEVSMIKAAGDAPPTVKY
jgi:polyisoprenoid-binding protein YceI